MTKPLQPILKRPLTAARAAAQGVPLRPSNGAERPQAWPVTASQAAAQGVPSGPGNCADRPQSWPVTASQAAAQGVPSGPGNCADRPQLWPITASQAAAQGLQWRELRCHRDWLCWLEFDPADGATRLRGVKTGARGEAGPSRRLTPAGVSLASRVHEYGGGAYCLTDAGAVMVNESDQGLYLQPLDESAVPRCLYHHPQRRYGDLEYDPVFRRVLAVEEDHGGAGEAVNRLVAVTLADGARRVLVEGAGFYASPRVSPDGTQLAWIDWEHPHQPWLSTRLQRAALDGAGLPRDRDALTLGRYAGTAESVQQPAFGPDGALYFVSDRTGWWNLYRYKEGTTRALLPMEAEFGVAPWQLGLRSYCLLPGNRLALSRVEQGVFSLGVLALDSGRWNPLPGRWAACQSLVWGGERLHLLADTAGAPCARLRADPVTLRVETLERLSFSLDGAGPLSLPRSLVFESAGGQAVQGFFYPCAGEPQSGSRPPPLLVQLHGGPTAMADSRLDPLKQYWTQRGYALLDLNYRGSSGFGRAFRHSLQGAWGVAEVEDLFHACAELIRRGWVDPARIMIRGNSAGGYSVLRALADPRALGIRAGASHYGISDLELLNRQTHKFESRYLHWLIGDPVEEAARYRARSAIHASEALTTPLIFFQGGLDPVVPAVQTYRLYQQLRGRGLAVDYEAFSDERHGFRRAANRARVLERERAFYEALDQPRDQPQDHPQEKPSCSV